MGYLEQFIFEFCGSKSLWKKAWKILFDVEATDRKLRHHKISATV